MAANSACQQAQHQPHGCARVAALEHFGRLLEAIKAGALDSYELTGLDRRNLHAHSSEAGGGAERVFRR